MTFLERFALAALAVACACQAPTRDFVRVGADVDAGSLDPRLMRDTTAYRVVDLLYDGLVRLDASTTPVPALATHWEQVDDVTWTFVLRQGVRFHDGSPFTAADVVHTFETLLDPSFGAPLRSLFAPIVAVEAGDAHTVTFTLAHPYAPLLSYLDVGIVPEAGGDAIGTGPYRLAHRERGSSIVLEANGSHWDGTPEIGRVEFLVVPDNTSRAQAFEAGDLDIVQSPLAPLDVNRLANDERHQAFVIDGLAITYFNFNQRRAPLDDPNIRRALAMLIDQESIVGRIYEGADRIASSVLLPSSWAHASQMQQPRFDPEAADRLLDEAGYRDTDGDGLRDKDGRPLSIEIGTHSEDASRVQTVELLQQTLRDHGISAELRISDWPSFSVRRDASDFDLILLGWTQLVDPDRVLYEQLHSTGGLNWGGFDNERFDTLVDEARQARSREARASLYGEAAGIVATELPYFVLSYQGYQLFATSRLSGYEPDRRGMLRSLTTSRLLP